MIWKKTKIVGELTGKSIPIIYFLNISGQSGRFLNWIALKFSTETRCSRKAGIPGNGRSGLELSHETFADYQISRGVDI